MFSYNIIWGATKKEVERSNFFIEVPKIFKRFRVALFMCFLATAMIVVMALPQMPYDWRIPLENWSVGLPLIVGIASHVVSAQSLDLFVL